MEQYTRAVSYTHLDVYKRQELDSDLDTESLNKLRQLKRRPEDSDSNPSTSSASIRKFKMRQVKDKDKKRPKEGMRRERKVS